MKVRVDAQDVCYYPDVSVVCDPEDDDPYVKRRPCILVEVLSDTTENTDRREKWLAYRSITTLRYYLLVSSDHRRIEYCQRATGGVWNTAIQDTTEPLKLRCNELSADLDLKRVYEDVVFARS
jgi:Uma2 family endonuclease